MSELHDPTRGLTVVDGDRVRLGTDDLTRALASVGLEELADASLLDQALATHGISGREFEVRLGQWSLDLPAAVARGVLNGAVLTAVLAAQDEASIPATVLSVVVPLVFDLERIQVSPADKLVYAHLLRDAPGRQRIDDWYATLPTHVRDEVTRLEFRDLLGRLEEADLVTVDDLGVVLLDPPTPRRLVALRLPPPS